MLRHSTVPAARAWYTWSARPLEMVFLPLGVRITPLAYSAASGRATLYPPGPDLRFGRHALDGGYIEARARHAGTELDWAYRKPDPYRVVGSWRTVTSGEWGLRFWINLCLSAEGGSTVRFDEADQAAIVKINQRFVALVSETAPVQVTGHDTVEAAAQDYERNGYFDTRSRSLAAPALMLRFNLEMMPAGRFAAAVADDRAMAVRSARQALETPESASMIGCHTGRHAGSLDAVRDVMAWNTVWDELNGRPYTSISRNWNLAKFGGYGVWLDDQFFHALMTGLTDPCVARENLAVALANATPQGNLACLLTARDAWVDRTQIPIGAFIVRLIHLRLGARDLLDLAYPTLSRNHDWWWQTRDPEQIGLCSYGTSAVGDALYQGTAFGARNESSMDNSPIHDEASYDPETRTLTTIDVGLNSMLALDAEMLSELASELGLKGDASRYTALAERTRGLIRERLWDETRGIFANRLRSGPFVRSIGPTSFYPLVAGAATLEQTESLLRHLDDTRTFAGAFMLPSISRDDPAFTDNVYWRGRVWPPLNYFVWQGLRRAGFHARAAALAEVSLDLFRRAWDDRRLCPENYNAETGEALDQADTEGFYGWGALIPLMGVAEVTDISPWDGWTIVNTGADSSITGIETPVGTATITVEAGRLCLKHAEETLFETTMTGRLEHICWGGSTITMVLPPTEGDVEIVFPAIPAAEVDGLTIGGIDAGFRESGGGITVMLIASTARRRLVLRRR